MTRSPEPLTPEEEAEARRYFTEPAPPRYNPMAWREWANSLSWKVGLYGARLFATLDAARAAVPDTGASLDVAWKAAKAALPEGWAIKNLSARFYPVSKLPSHWTVEYIDEDGHYRGDVSGPTPAAALLALAARLSEPAEGLAADPMDEPCNCSGWFKSDGSADLCQCGHDWYSHDPNGMQRFRLSEPVEP